MEGRGASSFDHIDHAARFGGRARLLSVCRFHAATGHIKAPLLTANASRTHDCFLLKQMTEENKLATLPKRKEPQALAQSRACSERPFLIAYFMRRLLRLRCTGPNTYLQCPRTGAGGGEISSAPSSTSSIVASGRHPPDRCNTSGKRVCHEGTASDSDSRHRPGRGLSPVRLRAGDPAAISRGFVKNQTAAC